MLNNETTVPPNMSLPQNEDESQHDASTPEAQTNITNNLASNFASESAAPTFEKNLKSIKQGIKTTIDLHLHPETTKLQCKFIEKTFKHKIHHCHYCKERCYDIKGHVDRDNNFECQKCERTRKDAKIRLMSNENTMDPIPELNTILLQLPELTGTEQMLIARVHVVIKACRLSKGNIGHQGNMLNTDQDIIILINKLPFTPKDLPLFVARKNNPNNRDRRKDFKINRTNILIWLLWLKENSSHYADMTIDYVALNQLPIDGSMFY